MIRTREDVSHCRPPNDIHSFTASKKASEHRVRVYKTTSDQRSNGPPPPSSTKFHGPPPQFNSPRIPGNRCQRAPTRSANDKSLGKGRLAIELQPEFSPISQEQLAAEVKGIYAGLVMVEAKCINIDTQKASHPEEGLSTEQWQALVALHRTLVYEHHDFLVATQHPSATQPGEPTLHIEQMQALIALHRTFLYEHHDFLMAIGGDRDTPTIWEGVAGRWYAREADQRQAEKPGDLARDHTTIEDGESREICSTRAGVTARWYAEADEHRSCHHPSTSERPLTRNPYLYSRALTPTGPSHNTSRSLGTLSPLCMSLPHDETPPTNMHPSHGTLVQQLLDWSANCQQHLVVQLRQTLKVLKLSAALCAADNMPRTCASPIPIPGEPAHDLEAVMRTIYWYTLTLAPLVVIVGSVCRITRILVKRERPLNPPKWPAVLSLIASLAWALMRTTESEFTKVQALTLEINAAILAEFVANSSRQVNNRTTFLLRVVLGGSLFSLTLLALDYVLTLENGEPGGRSNYTTQATNKGPILLTITTIGIYIYQKYVEGNLANRHETHEAHELARRPDRAP